MSGTNRISLFSSEGQGASRKPERVGVRGSGAGGGPGEVERCTPQCPSVGEEGVRAILVSRGSSHLCLRRGCSSPAAYANLMGLNRRAGPGCDSCILGYQISRERQHHVTG